MRLTEIGPFFIVLGTVVSALPTRIQMLGKAGFYFGFIFFGLDLLSGTLKPLAETPVFENLVRRADMPLTGVLVGVVLTALVQSSTIVTGLCIVMVQQGILTTRGNPDCNRHKHRHHFEGAVNHNRNEGGCTPRRHR